MHYVILTCIFSPLLYILILIRKRENRGRILVIQTAKIGDMVCSTHIFREIKKKYPETRLTVMINPVTAALLDYNPHVDEIIAIKGVSYRGLAGKLRLAALIYKGGYDVAISLNPSLPFLIASLWGIVPLRVFIMPESAGITYRMASIFSSHLARHVKGRLAQETYMDMLSVIGINNNDMSKEVYQSPDASLKVKNFLGDNSKKIMGIAVTSGNKMKEWGVGKIISLTERSVTGLGAAVVLIGSEGDMDRAMEIISVVKGRGDVINAVGRFTLAELPALLRKLSLFVGVDTGILYMADALGIPVVDIAGPSDMDDQRPLGKDALVIQRELPCVPCSHAFSAPYACRYGHTRCIKEISTDEVFGAIVSNRERWNI